MNLLLYQRRERRTNGRKRGGANGGYEEVREEALIVLALSQGQ